MLSASVDGWFTLPFTIPNYLAHHLGEAKLAEDAAAPVQNLAKLAVVVSRAVWVVPTEAISSSDPDSKGGFFESPA